VLVSHDFYWLTTLAEEVAAKAKREQWTNAEELLATVAEMLSAIRAEALLLGGVKGRDLPPPLRIERPGAKPKHDGVRVMTPREYARAMAAQGV
jgi:hypothetical protein